jgi:pimeloyl-ACP methyl ester carboxylesterase
MTIATPLPPTRQDDVAPSDVDVDTNVDSDVAHQSAGRSSTPFVQEIMRRLWADWRAGAAIGMLTSAVWGLMSGRWTPRGPLTTGQALITMAVSFVVGALAGWVTRSRWAMLVAPAVFAAVFELARIGTDGPTVDGPHFTTYGILALVVGRGFHGLVSLAPMTLGAAWAVGAARRFAPAAPSVAAKTSGWGHARRSAAVVCTVALIGLAVLIARPATTDAIVDADGNRLAGSVAELTAVDINGNDLALLVRGHSIENPVLLFLAGGPGGSEMGAMRRHLPALEEHFTVVTFDQRGAGKSYPALDPTSTLTLESSVDDAIAVTNYLRDRFETDQIYLVGQSWGSILGVIAVQEHPELFEAFIGVGQMVSPVETDRIFYADTLAWARQTGNAALVGELEAIGPPPYDDMLNYEIALSHEHEVYPYDHSANSEGEAGFSENLFVEEYTLTEQVHALGAFMDTFQVLYPQIQDVDFRDTATEFQIPVYFAQGAHEAGGRAEPFAEWYPTINAPLKDTADFDTSGHRPMFEQPDEFVAYMVDTVLEGSTGR